MLVYIYFNLNYLLVFYILLYSKVEVLVTVSFNYLSRHHVFCKMSGGNVIESNNIIILKKFSGFY